VRSLYFCCTALLCPFGKALKKYIWKNLTPELLNSFEVFCCFQKSIYICNPFGENFIEIKKYIAGWSPEDSGVARWTHIRRT
jgi:hypothetical protein